MLFIRCGVITPLVVLGAQCAGYMPAYGQEDKPANQVTLLRVPDRGIQPQVAVDAKGVIHLIYYKGSPEAGDIFYVRSENGTKFSSPMRVNSEPGSAIAVGNIRGAHLALGKNGRVHVAWMGSDKATPRAPGDVSPMLYARMNVAGDGFETQRNLIQQAVGLDGGGSVAADRLGHVYVAWHAAEPGKKGEENRRVWVARSTDEGKTFSAELPAFAEPTGACGCCGMRVFADSKGNVYMLYRSAMEKIHRDIYLLASTDHGLNFQGKDLHPWRIESCPIGSAAFAEKDDGVIAAWETQGQVYFATIDTLTGKASPPVSAPGATGGRRHPVVAGNAKGETILVWTEGMGWQRGGSLAWQVFDKLGTPTGVNGQARGVPTWSLVAVFARPDGGFTVLY